jgi:BirA family biotin operon repressor/biotin-[acetyl-CoA-carboxylase] ligase
VHFRQAGSTNRVARELALSGAPHGTLVTADEQTAGRGRQGRTWVAPPRRSLLVSLLLRGLDRSHALLPLAVALAVCDTCEAVAPVDCRIKWPNDVWIGDRKVAGILLEGRPHEGWAVVGIGLNVATTLDELAGELGETATSLAIATGGRAPSLERTLDALLEALERRLADPPSAILAAWRERDVDGPLPAYEAGSAGPAEADALLGPGREWRKL